VRQLFDLIILLVKWTLGLTLVGAIALGFYAYHRLDEEVRATVEQRLGEKYPHLKVSVRAAHLVQGEGIRVRGLSIIEPNPSGPQEELFFVDEMFVHCSTDPRVLLQGKLDVARVTLRKPIVRAALRHDGRWSAAQLLPLPSFGPGTPTGIIEGGMVEIVDVTGPIPTKVVLRDAHFKCEPVEAGAPNAEGRKPLRISGHITGDHIRNLEFEGWFDPSGAGWSLAGDVGQLDVSPELQRSLPNNLGMWLGKLGALRARADAKFRLGYQAATDRSSAGSFQFDVAGKVVEGRLEDPRLPYPLVDVACAFHCHNGGLEIAEGTGRYGPSTLRLDLEKVGLDEVGPLSLRATTQRLPLDAKMLELLPESLRTQWHNFLPAGEIDLDVQAKYADGLWHPEATIVCHDVAFTYHKFPYRLERTRGQLKLVDRQLTLDLTASAAGEEAKIVGQLSFEPTGPHGWTEIRAQAVPIDDRLVRALPAKAGELIRALHPQGRCNLYFRAVKELNGDGIMHKHALINLVGGSLRYDKFPYPLHEIFGTVEMRDEAFVFHDDLRAVNDTGRITCRGQLLPDADGGELTLTFHGDQLPIDEELRDALNPGSQRLWNDMKPRGMLNLDAEIRYRLREKALSVAVRAEPVGDTASIEPSYFPYRMEKLHGTFSFADGQLQMEQLRAEHGRTQISASGVCRIDPQGGWRLQLDRMFVDRLQADRDLLNALPEALKRSTAALDPKGFFNVRGSLVLAGGGVGTKSLASEWNVNVDCHNNALLCGVELNGIHGTVWLAGKSVDGRFESTGELQLDSIAYKDYQCTEVLGPLWIDNEQVLLGFWADRRRGQSPERHLTGKLCSGAAVADGWVVLGEEPEYAFLATLSQASLAQLAQEHLPGTSRLSGEIAATIDLRGKGRTRNNIAGRGSVQLRNANVYQLPAMVSLLKVLSLRSPDTSAFTESDINFMIQGEHCYLERIDFDGKAISLQGRGELNLANDAIALVFRTVVGSDAQRPQGVRQLLGGASQQILLIHVDGTLQNPQVRREAFPGVNQALEQLQAELQRPAPPRVPPTGPRVTMPSGFP
jgi:hypothetical protein